MDIGFEGFETSDFDVDVEDLVIKKTKTYDRVWNTGLGGSIDNNPIIHKGVIYFGAQDGYVYGVDEKTGKIVWIFKTNDLIVASSPAIFENSVIIGSFDYNMYRIHSSPDTKLAFVANGWTEEEIKNWTVKAHKSFYLRPGFLIRQVLEIRSFLDIQRYLRAFKVVISMN